MTDNVIQLGAVRFDSKGDCKDISPRDALLSLMKRIDDGEAIGSIVVISLIEVEDGTVTELTHAGPASTMERLGILSRANAIMNGRALD